MENYLLRNLNVVLASTNNDTSTFELIVEFDTLHYGVKLRTENVSDDHLTLIYEIDDKLQSPSLYHNGFIYSKTADWLNYPLFIITIVVEYPNETEASAVTKSEKDVIKPSGESDE
jgi:hypothetical protein